MNLPDVNVLVYAHRVDMEHHAACRVWLEKELRADVFAIAPLVINGFLRIVTHPRIFADPTPIAEAIRFTREVTSARGCRVVVPGPRCMEIFLDLVQTLGATGNAIPDLFLAAMAIESGSRWITVDGGFSKIPGLTWGFPWDAPG